MLPTTDRFRPPAPTPRHGSLGPIGLLRALWNNPLEAWSEAHFQKPIVTTGLGFGNVAVVSDPDAIRRVLVDNRANFRKDALQRRVMSALGNGLLTAEDEQWHVQRRMLAPVFTRKTLRSFAPAMAQAADELVERWRRCDGHPVDVAADVTRLTLEVLERTIFSDGLGRDTEEVRAAMRIYFDSIGRIDPFDVLGVPDFVPRLGRLGARGSLRLFRRAVDTIIATRRARLAEAVEPPPRDILTLLLEAKDPETGGILGEEGVKANIITLIVAGHETTANAVVWTLFLLSQSPAWRERVAAEIDRESDGAIEDLADRLVETRAVLEEAMRLYPPLPAISRVAVETDDLSGVRIRRGSLVVIAPYVVHRHRLLWNEPDVFDPGRFLPGAREDIDPFSYLPFGRGPRGCIGVAFAMQEATLILQAIIRNLDLSLLADQAIRAIHRVTLRPSELVMVVKSKARASTPAPRRPLVVAGTN